MQVSLPADATLAKQLRGSFLIAAGLYFVDAIWLGQGAIAIFGLLVILFFALPRTLWAWKNKPLRNLRAAKLLIYLIMVFAIGATIQTDLALAKQHAETVIAALKQYQAKHGAYPDKLEQLVPEFLPAIPDARFSLTQNTFFYHAADNSHNLSYMVMPPFGWELHNLETGRWTVRD